MARASARHILVKTEEQCNNLKAEIANGASFAEIAQQHSLCPSGKQGGDLGEFSRGQMVKEFDTVVAHRLVKYKARLKLSLSTFGGSNETE